MIEGGWSYIVAAYAVAVVALVALTLSVILRAHHWAKQARALEDKTGPKSP